MTAIFVNNAISALASGVTDVATSMTLTTGEGALFPNPTGSEYFYATLIDTSGNLEIVKCTTRATDVLTVVRGAESTTAQAWSAGDRIEVRITAGGLMDTVAAAAAVVASTAADAASAAADAASTAADAASTAADAASTAADAASTAADAAAAAGSATTAAATALAAKITVSTSSPSGGSDGDIWFKVSA
jgi:hypothetical protein